ncbi:polysaccharide biosynthesis tyrosine autokinase [Rubripirellula reticaptiva]|uniref:Tyrosine-protein kinase YwqD n=1 Tax=Rubripirellula reticaptiva TaxID=2528013 RepID=A0A5C6F3H8_9BACT|nr:polysaccharide biosynthesis tyrosine autokinase [Rubripirellula reticaptiva]TWU55695.1 Tyrosine-protein kinase YwqD [Rubripirellula reticaptiva]
MTTSRKKNAKPTHSKPTHSKLSGTVPSAAPRSSSKARAHAPVDSESSSFDPWILWVTFRRCWPWAVPAGMVLAGVAAMFVLQGFVPRYEATHLLVANDEYVVFDNVMKYSKDLARTETALILNPIVLVPALADPSLHDVPSLSNPATAEAHLRSNLTIKSGGDPKSLEIRYEDTDPEVAKNVCNAVAKSYLRQRDSFDAARVTNIEEWLEPEIQQWEQRVEERQARVQTLSEQTLGFAPGKAIEKAENESNLALLTQLRSEIGDLKIELSLFDAGLYDGGNLAASPVLAAAPMVVPEAVVKRGKPSESEIASHLEADPRVAELVQKVNRYRASVLDMEVNDMVRVNRDYYKELNKNLASAESELQSERREARDRTIEKLERFAEDEYERQKVAAKRTSEWQQEQFAAQAKELAQQSSKIQSEVSAAEKASRERQRFAIVSRLEILQAQYNEESERLEKFGGTTAQLQFAQDELAVASGVLKKLRDRVAAIKTERRQDGAVRTLAEATAPKSPIETVPYKKLAMASSVAFMVPFLIGLIFEYRVQRVTDASSFTRSGDMVPIMGEVARLPSGSRSQKGRRVFEESIDTLRANLFLSMDTSNVRSIAVVSGMSGEGKSSVSSQLALSIAKATGETVLLVDGDLRCPDQHEIFGLEMGDGFAGVLSGKTTLIEAVDTSLGALIHVLPAGRLTASPHRLMSPSGMKDFVDHALSHYSYVVMDTAPVLSAGETLAVASAVDASLICVMRDVSRIDNVTRTTRRLEAAGASIAGTVFSGVSARQYSYRYGDYHYALGDVPFGDSSSELSESSVS